MRLVLKSTVKGDYKEVMSRFDRNLFEFLKPKGANMEFEKFTGSKTGDEVHLKFVSPIKMKWVSHIIDHGTDHQKTYFVDKGVVLPFFLGFWEHHHIIENHGENCVIVDDMRFKAPIKLLTPLLYPMMLVGFLPRKKAYQEYFGKPV